MMVVGLTGNIGMGKSTVLKAFEDLGATTLNSDQIVAELLDMPMVMARTITLLGPEVMKPEGGLDKAKIASLIFNDDEARAKFEQYLHPLVFERIDDLLRGSKAPIVIIEVPLLFEASHEIRFSKIITVYSDENVALDRLTAQGLSRDDIVRRMSCQSPIVDKVRKANYTVDNNGNMTMTKAQVRQIYRVLQSLA